MTNNCAQAPRPGPQIFPRNLEHVAHLLPEMIKDLGNRIGLYEAFSIAKSIGGTSTYIPKNESSETAQYLIQKLESKELAKALIKNYGGEILYIPRCSEAERELRNIEIHCTAALGISAGRDMNSIVNELALMHAISDRHVWRILKKPPSHPHPKITSETH